ncbi:MAG: hypothetical protein K5678_06205 [Acetatifactor sp.]|nr:hypothetical protein [Acetatifactor sp.]
MTNDELRIGIVYALEQMKNKANAMKITGVATASVLNQNEAMDWIGEMKVVGEPYNAKEGWNLVAIAWSKCGEVIASESNSGNPNRKRMMGELGFVGGAYEEYDGYKMAFAFSGALSEEDLEVAQHGIATMRKWIAEN